MRKIAPVLMVALMVLGMLATILPARAAANPSIAQIGGGASFSVSSISVSLTSVTAGDVIVVVEYYATSSTPCKAVKAPTDSMSNNYQTLGCVQSGAFAAQAVYYVQSAGGAGADTVSCNFQPNADVAQACYVFDITSGGTVSMLTTASTFGSSIGAAFVAQTNSLILNTIGMDSGCQAVGISGSINPIPTIYNPSSECNSLGIGLSGAWQISAGGTDQWTSSISGNPTSLTESIVQILPSAPPLSTSTTYTATVIGWLVPDATHFSNALILIILPLMGMVFGIFPFTLGRKPEEIGDRAIFPGLIGFTVGAAFADLAVNGTSQLQIPFAFIFVAALITFLWWWSS